MPASASPSKPRDEWNVLTRDNHSGYINWQEYEDNQKLLLENAHMKKNCARKSRGGRALLTGLMRCGRCGRMMRVFYGMAKGNAHRYQCAAMMLMSTRDSASALAACGFDRAVALQILEAVSDRAVEAAIFTSDQAERSRKDIVAAVERELEAAATMHRWPDADTSWSTRQAPRRPHRQESSTVVETRRSGHHGRAARHLVSVAASRRGTNLVIFPADLVEGDHVVVHDPDHRLPQDQSSWS